MGERDDEVGLFAGAQILNVSAKAVHLCRVHAPPFVGRLALAGADVGYADNRHPDVAALKHHPGRIKPLARGRVVEIIADHRAAELRHRRFEDFGAVRRLPVAGRENIELHRLQRLKDRFALRPSCGPRALEIVAPVENETGAASACSLFVDGRLEAGKAAHHLELRRCAGQIIEMRLELGVRVGEVKQRHPLAGKIVKGAFGRRPPARSPGIRRLRPRRRASGGASSFHAFRYLIFCLRTSIGSRSVSLEQIGVCGDATNCRLRLARGNATAKHGRE